LSLAIPTDRNDVLFPRATVIFAIVFKKHSRRYFLFLTSIDITPAFWYVRPCVDWMSCRGRKSELSGRLQSQRPTIRQTHTIPYETAWSTSFLRKKKLFCMSGGGSISVHATNITVAVTKLQI
jgi:hypothetical protein